MAANVIDSFLIALGFQTDTSGAEDYKKSLEEVGLKINATMLAIGAAALSAGALITKSIISVASQFEQFETILSTLEGGEEKGRQAMDWVSDFATRTPYELGEVTDAFVKLRSYGLDPTQGLLETLGDTASAMGKPIMEAVEAIADAVTGQNERLKEFGITSEMKGTQVTYSWVQDGETRTKSVDKSNKQLIQSTLESIWNEKYKGNMDKLSKTWKGVWSNISDSLVRIQLRLSKEIFPSFKKWAESLLSFFTQIAESKALELLGSFLGSLFTAFEVLLSPIKAILSIVPGWVWGLGAMTAGLTLLGSALYMVGGALWFVTKRAIPLIASIGWLPVLIGAIAAAIVLLVDEFVNFKEGNDSFLGDLVREYPQLLGVINSISDGISAVIDWLGQLFEQIKEPLMALGGALINLFMALWPAVKFVFTVIGAVIMAVYPIVLWLATQIVNLIAWAIELAVSIITGLVNAFTWVVNVITGILNFLVGIFTGAWEAIKSGFTAVFDWMAQKFDAVVGKVKDAISWVGNLIGLSDTAAVKVAAANAGNAGSVGYSPSSATPASGALGVAAGPSMNSSSVTQSTTVNVPQIVVNSPDPAKAGQSVREELERMNRQTTRNGQSAVLL